MSDERFLRNIILAAGKGSDARVLTSRIKAILASASEDKHRTRNP